MTRNEVLGRLKEERAKFDQCVAKVPRAALDRPIPGSHHCPKQIVAHVCAYERLIVERLRAARLGEETAFDRDRVGWEAFNERIWRESAEQPVDAVLYEASHTFLQLLEEVAVLTNRELEQLTGVTAAVDPAWLKGRSLAELIGVDGFEHYGMHLAQLQIAAGASDAA